MATKEPADDIPGLVVSVYLSPERAVELARLAQDRGKDMNELAREYLETEIEAEHGLRYGRS